MTTQRIFEYPRSSYSAVWLLRGWCHVKLLPSRHKFCVHHTTVHQFAMSFSLKPHNDICRMHVCLAQTSHSALLAERLGSFACYCGNMGVEWILK